MENDTMMKLCIAIGLGLLLFMAAMVGGPAGMSQAQAADAITLADLAGKFAGRGSGFLTICFSAGVPISCSSVSATPVPYNFTDILQTTRDAAGNSCGVSTSTFAPVSGTKFPALVSTRITLSIPVSFDLTTGSGIASFKDYVGGSCNGAVFDGTGTLAGTGTHNFFVSDSGNRIERITTSFSVVAGTVKGFVFSATFIRQPE